jgi:dienelactone hydrolase
MKPPLFLTLLVLAGIASATEPIPLAGTAPLNAEGDLSAQMVAGIERYLVRETEHVHVDRAARWKADGVEAKRERLRKMLGAVDARISGKFEILGALDAAPTGDAAWSAVHVRWPVFDGVWGEGLLLRPRAEAKAFVIALPDADETPEQCAGLAGESSPSGQLARRLVQSGCVVLVPTLVDRSDEFSGNEKFGRFTNCPHREWIYRLGFEVGRTIIGLEVQKVLAALDAQAASPFARLPSAVAGYGEGGLIAFYAAALDERVKGALISGYFGPREGLWAEPIYRNVFGLLRDFGDAEIAALIAPRRLVIDQETTAPAVAGPPAPRQNRSGAAPGRIPAPTHAEVQAEGTRLAHRDAFGLFTKTSTFPLLDGVGVEPRPSAGPMPAFAPTDTRARQRRTIKELETHLRAVFDESNALRKTQPLWTKLAPGADWEAVQKQARADFWEHVIGKLPTDYLPPNVRTRQIYDREKWTGYDVMLDVLPDVFAWGVLLVPKDLKPGERRPVVVCQHGLEGVPVDTIEADPKSSAFAAYKDFAARLADRGFIVYAPHNPYRGQDAFRVLQRRANPLGLSLYSFINAQHDVTTRWLAALPFVDSERIGFYGLSYGGKTAMRVPAVLDRYCLSICSGDFNEWVRKNVSIEWPGCYVFTGEYEIWEWDLAHTFNYAEMALLIAPRPFMVERGHEDGVGIDEHVGWEWAKVRRGYDKLRISDRAEIEWFDGPHTINGVGTFQFLHKHLRWPEPASK